MQNKKILVLLGLSIVAAVSLIYGILTPPKIKHVAGDREGPVKDKPKIEMVKGTLSTHRRKGKTKYTSWGRNPFELHITRQKRIAKFILNGIAWREKEPQAMINGVMLGIGDNIGENKVVEIKKDHVVLSDGKENIILKLTQ